MHLMIGTERSPVVPGRRCEGQGQAQRIECSIGNQEGSQQPGSEIWFKLERLRGFEFFQRNVAFLAALDELFGIGQIALIDRNKQSAVGLDHLRHDPAQDQVFIYTLNGRFLVLDSIAPAAVQ